MGRRLSSEKASEMIALWRQWPGGSAPKPKKLDTFLKKQAKLKQFR